MNPSDDRNDNDVMEMELPVALSRDDMDAGGDLVIKPTRCQFQPSTVANIQLTDDASGIGIWQEDNSASVVMQIGGTQFRFRYPSASRSV